MSAVPKWIQLTWQYQQIQNIRSMRLPGADFRLLLEWAVLAPGGVMQRELCQAFAGYVFLGSLEPCPICFEEPEFMKILDCGHVFCGDCVNTLGTVSRGTGGFPCPLCRRTHRTLHIMPAAPQMPCAARPCLYCDEATSVYMSIPLSSTRWATFRSDEFGGLMYNHT